MRRTPRAVLRGVREVSRFPLAKPEVKALLEKRPRVIMRQARHLRMLFNPMMLAHSALVTQLEFYDAQILKLAKGDETNDAK